MHDLFFLEERNSPLYAMGKVHQADIFRYLVVYEFGGVYADMDSVCNKPLDYMLDLINQPYEVLVPTERNSPYNNSMFAAVPKSSVLENIIRKIKSSPIKQEKYDKNGMPDPNTGIHYSEHFFPDGSLHLMWSQEVKLNTDALPLFSAGAHSKDYLTYPSNLTKEFDWIGMLERVDYYGEITEYHLLMNKLGISI